MGKRDGRRETSVERKRERDVDKIKLQNVTIVSERAVERERERFAGGDMMW